MQTLQDVHYALLEHGFVEYTPWKLGVYKYVGQLHIPQGSFDIELTLNEFDKPPDIRLVKIPESLKPRAPHIGASGSLCYSVSGTLALDIFNPASQVLACIERAGKVLSSILEGKLYDDLANEFFIHWDYFSFSYERLYLDTKDTHSGYVSVYGLKNDEGGWVSAIFTDDRARSQKKFKPLNLNLTEFPLPGCTIETTSNPYPYTDGRTWPPSTLAEFLDWQYSLDEKAAGKIIKRLKSIYEQGNRFAVILMSSPTSKYSANVDMPELTLPFKSVKQARSLLGASKFRVMETVRVDDAYVVERNQPNRKNLMSKKVLLVGAGAIGGHLSDLLVRSGAGFSGGSLTIIDKETLGIGNIGRHKLGFESLFSYKSEALKTQLGVSFPTADIQTSKLNIKNYSFLQGYDLIVNATGEQSLSDWLSSELNQKNFTPVLTVWIEGPGAVVRTVLQPTKSSACYRCLASIDREPMYPAVDKEYEIKLGGHGCESLYVEYPATAALFAASLASNHIMDWLNNEGSPLLRTMVINRNYNKNSPDLDPIKQPECPACSITKAG